MLRLRVRMIASGAMDPAMNMALDEALLMTPGPPTLRLYDWAPPALSIGYFQRHADVDFDLLARHGLVLVRRPTGGGAIAHWGELTFAITADAHEWPYAGPIAASYGAVHAAMAAGLARLGVAARARAAEVLASDVEHGQFYCFYKSAPVDLVVERRKLLGSAQRRIGGRVLHHGSLAIKQNPITPAASCLEGVLHREVNPGEVARAVVAGLGDTLHWQFERSLPTAEELVLAQRLAAAKHCSEAFLKRR